MFATEPIVPWFSLLSGFSDTDLYILTIVPTRIQAVGFSYNWHQPCIYTVSLTLPGILGK